MLVSDRLGHRSGDLVVSSQGYRSARLNIMPEPHSVQQLYESHTELRDAIHKPQNMLRIK
jgi:hypothetical protein